MKSRVLYQQSTGWITIHISDYHTWQGHISDVPHRFLGYVFNMQDDYQYKNLWKRQLTFTNGNKMTKTVKTSNLFKNTFFVLTLAMSASSTGAIAQTAAYPDGMTTKTPITTDDFADSVKDQISGVLSILISIGEGMVANADKFTTARLIREGKSRAEAERIVMYAYEERLYKLHTNLRPKR